MEAFLFRPSFGAIPVFSEKMPIKDRNGTPGSRKQLAQGLLEA